MAVSCNVSVVETAPEELQFPDTFTMSVPGSLPGTKVDFSVSTGRMIGTWSEGDAVCVTPGLSLRSQSRKYRVTNPGTSTGTFVREGSGWSGYYSRNGLFYPGDRVNSQISYWEFNYSGQVQSKSDPLAHTKNYYSFMAEIPSGTVMSFGSATDDIFKGATSFVQSSCMKMTLSGMTFNNPTEIMLSISGGTFYLTNYHGGSYMRPEEGEEFSWPVESASLSLGLSGYGTETSIEAYLMMSDGDVDISAGGRISVSVVCSDGTYTADVPVSSAMKLNGGYMHVLNVDSGWADAGGDYTHYEWDGDVVTLQERHSGLDLVLMGDGFIAADFAGENDGTYGTLMREAADEFFAVQPLKTWKDEFNIYYVKVPSPERLNAINTGLNGAQNTGSVTKLGVTFTPNSTSVSGDDATVLQYAKKAFSDNVNARAGRVTVIVVANQGCRAGTCVQSFSTTTDYGQGYSIAYCALGKNITERHDLVHHEASGHGFGKLSDEYTANSYYPNLQNAYDYLDYIHGLGVGCNVGKYDSTINASNVYWHSLFGQANNYESTEGLGVYDGAYAVNNGFCRPTDDSIMNSNAGIFNAPSRRIMYYRYRHLRGELTDNTKAFGTQDELDAFLEFDAKILPELVAGSGASRVSPAACNSVEEVPLPFGKPVLVCGHWENGGFVRDEMKVSQE